MTAHTAKCEACGETVSGEIYHLGFSDMDALYCSSCPKVLLLRDRSLLENLDIERLKLEPGDPGWQEYGRHSLPVYAKIENLFNPCECGGVFRYMNPPRCPKCRGLLRGDLYEDKPVLKSRDGYVFVTAGSVNDLQQLKSEYALQHAANIKAK